MRGTHKIHIGTSGWHYDHWKGPFYPPEMRSDEFLAYYTQHFSTVEINNTFYQLPDIKTLKDWRDTVPEEFTFSVKASRYITHMKKLKDPREPVANFITRIAVLEDKLGPILFQLPPNWRVNPERLDSFLEQLPSDFRYTFEFRDPSWFDERVYAVLAKYGASICIYHFDHRLSPKKLTADFIYVRLHGPGGAYEGKYDPQALSGWVGAFSAWADQTEHIYCYFDNDAEGFAPQNATRLSEMVAG